MVPGMTPLTDRDRLVLELAALPLADCERAARERLGVDRSRFHQLLNRVIDEPAALVADPVLVNRLRRLRDERARTRARRRPLQPVA